MSTPSACEGTLECGLKYVIEPSRKKSPGLTAGAHFIAVIKGQELSIAQLPAGAFLELCGLAYAFADANAFTPGAFRVAYNGPSVARRTHAHIHIMLPGGVDSLPNLVEGERTLADAKHAE
jgi:hypothetical protein